jgi:hypothetical protein
MNVHVSVLFGRKPHHFVGWFHKAESSEQLHLDPQDVYLYYGKSIPSGTHFEIELTSPIYTLAEQRMFHIHKSRINENPFICYPIHIPTLTRALKIFGIWCLKSVCIIETKSNPNTILDIECNGDEDIFEKVMQDRYHIRFV